MDKYENNVQLLHSTTWHTIYEFVHIFALILTNILLAKKTCAKISINEVKFRNMFEEVNEPNAKGEREKKRDN